ncbi:isochorismatase [Thermosporothrix hazakensis]|jgi:nicotinamidase-related amidase|nr:isochorismatase [Thermosporothrix hazakensis]
MLQQFGKGVQAMKDHTALLIIDMQVGLLEGAYQSEQTLNTIRTLLDKAHAKQLPVLYVQHDGPAGDPLEPDTPGWQLHPAIAPAPEEPVIRKQACDAFYETELEAELQKRHITHLIVTGGQTEYCVDSTTRSATAHHYDVTLVSDAHTTSDSSSFSAEQIIRHHNELLNWFQTGEYRVRVVPAHEIQF